MKMEKCIAVSSPDRVSAIGCRNIATMKIREQRGEKFKQVSGRDYTILLMCKDCASDVLTSSRYTVLTESPAGFTSEAWEYDLL
jgi:hypothetical protein